MSFTKAVRKKAKLRLALTGPSGSGKTYGALLIANGLGGKVAVIDTEHDSASLYVGLDGMPEFDTMNLAPPFSPERFIAAIKEAEKAGYTTLIIDSITHEWNGSGGCLEINETLAGSKFRGNTWSAWNETTPRHRAFIDAILRSPMHIIATMRSKTETAQTEDGGRKKVIKLGMKSEQRDGADYEFTTVLDIVHDGHFALASKDRTGLFSDKDPQKITVSTGKKLVEWLESGEVPVSIQAEVDAAILSLEKAAEKNKEAFDKALSAISDEVKAAIPVATKKAIVASIKEAA
jgi:hypothetical protein